MLEDLGMNEEDEEEVPLPNINAATLKSVIQWASYHKDGPMLPEDDNNKEKKTDNISSLDTDSSRWTRAPSLSWSWPPTT